MLVFFACSLLWLLCIASYNAVFSGPFTLDDTPNLYGLSFIHDAASALAYSYNGPSGIRWLSYLSFTLPVEIQGYGNNNAFSFKLINTCIHAFNGILIIIFCRQLLSMHVRYQKHALVLAAITSTLWLIHPVHANTVLYVVQRMTLLSATFVLGGLIFHLHFISQHSGKVSQLPWLIYSLIMALFTLLGILCKESAVLLPLLAASTFAFIPQQPFRRWQIIVTFVLPYTFLLIVLMATSKLEFGGRNFTMYERLLSQAVIVCEYLKKLAFPSWNSFSLYYDDFTPVRQMSDTRFLLASAILCVFIVSMKLANKIFHGLWFVCLWFFAGHALESTIIPLELYFDHRNYLPNIGIMFGISLLAYHALNYHSRTIQALGCIALIGFALLFSLRLEQETLSWKNDKSLAVAHVNKHPDSMRAIQSYIETLAAEGKLIEATQLLEVVFKKWGIDISNALFQIAFACVSQPDNKIKHDVLINDLRRLPSDPSISDAMAFLHDISKNHECPQFGWQQFDDYTAALLANPNVGGHYHNLVFLQVQSWMIRNNLPKALEASYQLPAPLHTPNFVFLQMHLALSTHNTQAANMIWEEINTFDRAKKMLYKKDIGLINIALEKLRHEKQN